MSQRHSYLPVVLAVIMILLSLGLIGVWWWFVGEYNALSSIPTTTANSNATSNRNSASNTNTSAVTTPGTVIADAFVNLGKTFVIDSSFTVKNLPVDVFAGQIGDAYVADDFVFLIVHERDINTPVLPVDQAVTWAGVLVSNDRGTTWQKWYTIVDPAVDGTKLAHNVVGIFTLNKKMYLDVADARGAGSGEGNMRRIVSSNAGATWADGACYYMSMETYYKPTVADRQGVTVDGLTPGTNCAYTVATATASADSTKDWKTYTNTAEGFSVRYPTEWTAVESTSNLADSLRSIITFYSPQFQSRLNLAGEISIIRFANAENLSLAAYWNLVNDLGVTATPVPTTVNGFEAQRLDRLSNSSRFPSPRTDVHIKADGKIFGFIIQNVNGNFESQIDTFDLIVSTFQFAKETATKDWKTYSNVDPAFSFKYPPTWTVSQDAKNYPGQVAYIAKDPTGADGQLIVAPKGYPGSGAPVGTVTNQAIHFGTVSGRRITLTLPDKTIWNSYVNLEQATAPQGWEWAHPIHLAVGSTNSLEILNLILSTFAFTK